MRKKTFILMITVLFLLTMCFAACSSKREDENLLTRAKAIHDRVLTVDSHADTPALMLRENWDMGKYHRTGLGKKGKIDLPRMKEGGLDAEFFVAFVGQNSLTQEEYTKARELVNSMLESIYKMCKDYPDLVELATSPEDAYRIEKLGKRAAFIGLENGYPIGRDLSLINEFYSKGVRYITLCHSVDNDICDSSTDRLHPEDRGLSDFGTDVVAECNRLGIIVDVSHISDKSFFDVLEVTRAPVIASHSSVRALCDNPRNLTDEMLLALKENGGVIQICFYSEFINPPKPNQERDKALQELTLKYGSWGDAMDEETREKRQQEYEKIMDMYPIEKANLEELVDHIDYVVKLIGSDHVGIGTDFDGGGEVAGCADVSDMPNITKSLVRRGYSEEEIRKIWGGNFMRVFRRVLEIAASADRENTS